MSLVEPLLTKKEVEGQKSENYSYDPLANLEKSIEKLSVEYDSFEFDGSSDIEFRYTCADYDDAYPQVWKNCDIKCATTFASKLAIGRIDGIIKIYNLETKEEAVLKGHSNFVSCLQVCPKKDFLVSASRDGTIIIWNLENYRQERVFKGETEMLCLEVTIGYHLFSGALTDRLIKKWNFWNENEVSSLNGDHSEISCMKSSPNGEFLVGGDFDGNLIIWSVQDGQNLGMREASGHYLTRIMITDDSKYIAAESFGGGISIWDINTREVIKNMTTSFREGITIMDFTSGNQIVWAHSDEGMIRTYDIDNKTSSELKDPVTAFALSKGSNLIYCGHKNGSVTIFDLSKSFPMVMLEGIECKIINMLAIDQEKYLSCIHENGKIKIYQIYKEKKQTEENYIVPFCNNHDEIDYYGYYDYSKIRLKLTRDGKYAVVHNRDIIRVWSFIENKYIFYLQVQDLLDLQISYDDKYFLFDDINAKAIHVYSFQDMKLVNSFQVPVEDKIIKICFSISKDSRFLVVNNCRGKIKSFEIQNNSKIDPLEESGKDTEKENSIWFLQINKTNTFIISVDNEQNLGFWSFSEKKLMQSIQMERKVKILKLIESINCVLVFMENGIEIWSINERRKIITIDEHSIPISSLEISEDENFFIFSQVDEIRLWDLSQMKEIDIIKTYDGCSIVSLDITKDNKYIAILNANHFVKLWNCEEKKIMAAFQLPNYKWNAAKFSGDSKFIVVQSTANTGYLYIENYLECSRLDSDPYFIPGNYDKILRQRFANWIKDPTKELWDKQFLEIVVYPIGYNVLHSLCITDSVDLLSTALSDGAIIFRDQQSMSPLSYALIKSSRRCIDEILNYVINLDDDIKLQHCIHQLRDDVPLLFNVKPRYLIQFLEFLFMRRADKDLIGFYEITEELPMTIFSPSPKIYASAFTRDIDIPNKNFRKQKTNLVQFWGSPLGYNYTAGSDESLLLLKKMNECESQVIFQTLFVQSLVREKWNYLWVAIITISAIFWLNLIAMVWQLFNSNVYILSIFIALNGILALYEILQVITKPADYVSDIWNLIDFLRFTLAIIWAVFEFYEENIQWLSFAAVLFNFVRGLTYFRAFDFTRFYVRLILMALNDSFAFLIIFMYSTLAFGVLYASLNASLSFSDAWAMTYELNIGNFDSKDFSFFQYSCFTLASLINVVMMLNLLVSTLGDTFDRFQMIADELNSKEMLQLVIEFESLMFWKRSDIAKLNSKRKLLYLQRCDIFQDSNVSDKWQGKIKEISLKIDGYKEEVFKMKTNMSEEWKNIGENVEKGQESLNVKLRKLEEKVQIGLNENREKIVKGQIILNEKMQKLDEKMDEMERKIESKMNGIMEALEGLKKMEA